MMFLGPIVDVMKSFDLQRSWTKCWFQLQKKKQKTNKTQTSMQVFTWTEDMLEVWSRHH